MRVLDRYCYREMLPAFLIAAGMFTFLHVMDRLQDFSNMTVNGAPLPLVLRLWGLLLLSFMAHTLPMGLLLAVVIAAGRLASDLEVVALSAAGVSPLRLFRPFLTAALVVTALMASLTLWINPWGRAEFFRQLQQLQEHAATPLIHARTFTRIGDLVLYVEEVAPAALELRGLLIADERGPDVFRVVTAPHGTLIGDAEGRRTILRMTDGTIHESSRDTLGRYRLTQFGIYDAPLDVAAQIREARAQAGPEKHLTTWDLMSTTRALDVSRRVEKAELFVVELHKRLAFPLAPLVFALVGFPLGIRLHHGGRIVAAVGGIIVFLVYHVSQEALGRVRVLRSWGGDHWGPVVLFALLGLVLLHFTGRPAPRWWRLAVARFAALASALPTPRTGPAGGRRRGRRHSSHLVDRYLARQFLAYLAYGLCVSATIFVVVDLLETVSRHRPPLGAVLEHFLYRVPAALHQSLPFVVLAATIFLFTELNRHHELTAFKAAGLSLYRVSLPVLVVVGVVTAGAFVFQETALPSLNARGEVVDREKIRVRRVSRGLNAADRWYRLSDSEFFRIDHLDRAGRHATGVTLFEVDSDFQLLRRLDAPGAVWTGGGWVYGRTVVRDLGAAATPAPALSDIPESFEVLSAIQRPPSAMTIVELRAFVRDLRARGRQVGTWVLHLHSRLSFASMSAVLALVAIGCATRWAHGGRLVGGALGVLIAIAYWTVNSLALSFGRAELLPPIVAAWTASVVFAGIGGALFLRSPT